MTTPDTNAYLLLGLVVVFGVLALYISSLAIRLRNARRDAALVQQLIDE